MFKKWLGGCLCAIFLMSHNVSALELTSNVSLVRGSYRSNLTYSAVSGFGQNCAATGSYLVSGGGNDTPCYLSSISMSTWDGNYSVGDYIVQELYVHNTQVNNANDVLARFNSYYLSSTGNAGADLVDVKFENLGESSAKIIFTSRVWQAGNIYSLTYGFQQYAAFGLYNAEWLASGYTSIWHENNQVDYSVTIGNISSALGNQAQALQNIVDNTYFTHQDTASINTTTGVISGNVADIESLLNSQSSQLTDIANNTENVSDYVDEQRTAYQNMQNTDGLVNIGDQSQALGIVGSINSFLGNLSGTSATNCIFAADLGAVDMGNLDLCDAPSELRSAIGTIATIVFAVLDVLIAYSTIKYIIGVIDWARGN